MHDSEEETRDRDVIQNGEELTDVSADPAHQLPFPQLGDAEAAVPVTPAEQQAPVVGDHQHLSAELHSGRERPAEETLSPAGRGENLTLIYMWRCITEWKLQFFIYSLGFAEQAHLGLVSVGSLVKVK